MTGKTLGLFELEHHSIASARRIERDNDEPRARAFNPTTRPKNSFHIWFTVCAFQHYQD